MSKARDMRKRNDRWIFTLANNPAYADHPEHQIALESETARIARRHVNRLTPKDN